MKFFSAAVLCAAWSFVSVSAWANCAERNPALLPASNALHTALETFDEAVHENGEPEAIVSITHHFEEGLLDFKSALEAGATCKELTEEFQHFHEDLQLVYRALDQDRKIFSVDAVRLSWNQLVPAYVHFQNTLY